MSRRFILLPRNFQLFAQHHRFPGRAYADFCALRRYGQDFDLHVVVEYGLNLAEVASSVRNRVTAPAAPWTMSTLADGTLRRTMRMTRSTGG